MATLLGVGWLWGALIVPLSLTPTPTAQAGFTRPVVATMDSPAFVYSAGWQVAAEGADPPEPADPWQMPAGTLQFAYTGSELALLLAPGDYWSYLYVTVDGQPANRLPNLPGNVNSQGQPSGYRTFYAPERQGAASSAQWVRVHWADDAAATHQVYLELWRGWGQFPLRGVAIDGLPAPPRPLWPGIALLVLALWSGVFALAATSALPLLCHSLAPALTPLQPLLFPKAGLQLAPIGLVGGILLVGLGVLWTAWGLTVVGLLVLAWAGLQRPALWLAALLFGLPFYYEYPLPILPTRSLSLIDVGILGGLLLVSGHWLLRTPTSVGSQIDAPTASYWWQISLLLGVLVSWALLSAVQAEQVAPALREWRTVFLTGGLFALLLVALLRLSLQPAADQRWLIGAWLTGATVVALVGLWQYGSGEGLISAEGVQRVRAFYGSPNNLALYLERALAPLLVVTLFGKQVGWRWVAGGMAALLGAALLLTFSKGALLLGLPTLFVVLWLGGVGLLRQRGQSPWVLWALVGLGGVVALSLLPFLGTARFQRLLDWEQGTGFVRLQLWQSAWQMALDHPLWGVGPDNFLYAYRSLYLLPAAWQEPNLNHPHQWLLDWWTRLGIPGLLLALLWFGLLCRHHWQQLRQLRQPVLQLGCLAAVATALAHGLIDASYALPDLMIIWVLLTYLPASFTRPSPDVRAVS
ncbi:MAG: O-antigen ligase family protein [Caldilineaceae bacterium]|nr:O-antigen ligase family protein [Caldilineaceae bacterium]